VSISRSCQDTNFTPAIMYITIYIKVVYNHLIIRDLVIITSFGGSSKRVCLNVDSVLLPDRQLAVLRLLAGLFLVVRHRGGLFSMRCCTERVSSCRPKVKRGRMSHHLMSRCCELRTSGCANKTLYVPYYPRLRLNWTSTSIGLDAQDFRQFDGRGTSR
jgi:hypothetical protein